MINLEKTTNVPVSTLKVTTEYILLKKLLVPKEHMQEYSSMIIEWVRDITHGEFELIQEDIVAPMDMFTSNYKVQIFPNKVLIFEKRKSAQIISNERF